jgi:hemolysin activation/secretion protein
LGYKGTILQDKSTLDFNITANTGINGLGNSEREFADKRIIAVTSPDDPGIADVVDQAKPGYFFLEGSIAFERMLTESGWRTLLRSGGQVTEDLLVSNEQYSIGGIDTVRGYVESQNAGDYGYFGQLELRSPNWLKDFSSIQDSYSFLFADGGKVRMAQTNPEEDAKFSISSVGAGISAQALDTLSLSLQWAYPLESQGDIEAGDDRVHFSMALSF